MTNKSILTVAAAVALATVFAGPSLADNRSHDGDRDGDRQQQSANMMGQNGGMDMMQMMKMMHQGMGNTGMAGQSVGMGMMGQGPDGQGFGMGQGPGFGMMGQSSGSGMWGQGPGGQGMMGNLLMQSFDTDNDGALTPAELRAGLASGLKTYDADGDGSLSISEFETMNAAAMRTQMVDRFQALDEDGDGKVTSEEMTAPADRMERMQAWQASKGGQTSNNGQTGMPMMDSDKKPENK